MDAYFLIFVSLFRFFLQNHVRYVFVQNLYIHYMVPGVKRFCVRPPDLAFSVLWSSHHSKFSEHKLAFLYIGPRISTTVYIGE
jgi:hypothetical protein